MSTSTPPPVSPVRRPAPVRNRADALRLLGIAVARPLGHETLCIPLDAHGRGGVITVVDGTADPDTMLTVVELMALATQGTPTNRLVVASVRPHAGLLAGDIDRWRDGSELAARHDAVLVEWFVVGPAGADTPRDLLGEPERWGH